MPLNLIKSLKIPGETAIPKGTYKVTLDVVSPKFSKYPFYMKVCEGKLPRLIDVKGYEGRKRNVTPQLTTHFLQKYIDYAKSKTTVRLNVLL